MTHLVVADAGRMDLYDPAGQEVNGYDIHFETRPPEQTAIVRNLIAFKNARGSPHLAGLDTNGDLIIYFVPNPLIAGSNGAWIFDNLSRTHLDARGEETPEFVSNLTAFATPWDTMHIAGLDAAGHAQVVWWAPDSPLWRVTDLTESALEPRIMQGNLSAFITPWSTLHINGIDEQGQTVALWWAPEFAGNWRFDQLTNFTTLRLEPGTLTSYVTSWGGLNIVGRNVIDGRATSYWWSPESNVWTVEVLQVDVNTPGPPLAGTVASGASNEGVLNVFARGLDGHAQRIFWRPGDAGVWNLEDLTELA